MLKGRSKEHIDSTGSIRVIVPQNAHIHIETHTHTNANRYAYILWFLCSNVLFLCLSTLDLLIAEKILCKYLCSLSCHRNSPFEPFLFLKHGRQWHWRLQRRQWRWWQWRTAHNVFRLEHDMIPLHWHRTARKKKRYDVSRRRTMSIQQAIELSNKKKTT